MRDGPGKASCSCRGEGCRGPWKRNTKVAIKPGFEGRRERILPWHSWRVVHIVFTSWRSVPPLFSSCLALIGAPDRDAQHPFYYAFRCKALWLPTRRHSGIGFVLRFGGLCHTPHYPRSRPGVSAGGIFPLSLRLACCTSRQQLLRDDIPRATMN